MKTRVISALVGLVILAIVFYFLDTLLLNAVMGFIGVLAVLELLNAVKLTKNRGLSALSIAIAVAIPFVQERAFAVHMPGLLFVLILLLFIILLRSHGTLRVEQAAMMFFFSTFVPTFFSCAVFIRNRYGAALGGVYLLWALGSAWLSDTGAYFTGRAFGRRKLAQTVSPNKTVEGFVGGLVTAMIGMAAIAAFYRFLLGTSGVFLEINYLILILVTPLFASIGVLGDLSASVIKRQFGVKDFGHIMPGHGGILDRFDSVLFTLPAVFITAHYLPVAVLL